METGRVATAVRALRGAVDELLDVDLSPLAPTEVTALVRELEVERRRLAGVDQRVLSEIEHRGLAGEYGRTGTADLLTVMLRVAPGEAKARVAQARELQPGRTLTGEPVPAVLPRCAAAVREGEISPAHVSVIAKAIERIPAMMAFEAAPVAEAMLVEAARHQHPGAVGQTAALLLARLDPDGVAPRDEELERRRGFTLARRTDGSAKVSGEWTPELVAIWQAILDSLSVPLPAADGARDDRPPQQRRHDAMAEAGLRLLRSGTLPSSNGVPVTVLLRMRPQDWADGVARTSTGDIWPAERVRRNLGDAAIVPVVIDHDGAALMCARTKRLATRAQRLALTARDGGCVFPGCGRPAAWCEVHHVIGWEDGGPTDIDNLCLLCRFHHREFQRRGWIVEMADGVPQWRPPAFLDPDRRPIRNTVHHPPDLTFDVDIGQTG